MLSQHIRWFILVNYWLIASWLGLGLGPRPTIRPRVSVHPGVAAAAMLGLHDLVFADPGADYSRTVSFLLLIRLLTWMTLTLSFVCCINLPINHTYYSLYYCILPFTHACLKLRISAFNKDQWWWWWWSNHAVYAVIACKCLCVSMSITSRCSTKTDKRSIIPIKRSIRVMDFGLSMPNIFMKFERGHPQQRRQNVCG